MKENPVQYMEPWIKSRVSLNGFVGLVVGSLHRFDEHRLGYTNNSDAGLSGFNYGSTTTSLNYSDILYLGCDSGSLHSPFVLHNSDCDGSPTNNISRVCPIPTLSPRTTQVYSGRGRGNLRDREGEITECKDPAWDVHDEPTPKSTHVLDNQLVCGLDVDGYQPTLAAGKRVCLGRAAKGKFYLSSTSQNEMVSTYTAFFR